MGHRCMGGRIAAHAPPGRKYCERCDQHLASPLAARLRAEGRWDAPPPTQEEQEAQEQQQTATRMPNAGNAEITGRGTPPPTWWRTTTHSDGREESTNNQGQHLITWPCRNGLLNCCMNPENFPNPARVTKQGLLCETCLEIELGPRRPDIPAPEEFPAETTKPLVDRIPGETPGELTRRIEAAQWAALAGTPPVPTPGISSSDEWNPGEPMMPESGNISPPAPPSDEAIPSPNSSTLAQGATLQPPGTLAEPCQEPGSASSPRSRPVRRTVSEILAEGGVPGAAYDGVVGTWEARMRLAMPHRLPTARDAEVREEIRRLASAGYCPWTQCGLPTQEGRSPRGGPNLGCRYEHFLRAWNEVELRLLGNTFMTSHGLSQADPMRTLWQAPLEGQPQGSPFCPEELMKILTGGVLSPEQTLTRAPGHQVHRGAPMCIMGSDCAAAGGTAEVEAMGQMCPACVQPQKLRQQTQNQQTEAAASSAATCVQTSLQRAMRTFRAQAQAMLLFQDVPSSLAWEMFWPILRDTMFKRSVESEEELLRAHGQAVEKGLQAGILMRPETGSCKSLGATTFNCAVTVATVPTADDRHVRIFGQLKSVVSTGPPSDASFVPMVLVPEHESEVVGYRPNADWRSEPSPEVPAEPDSEEEVPRTMLPPGVQVIRPPESGARIAGTEAEQHFPEGTGRGASPPGTLAWWEETLAAPDAPLLRLEKCLEQVPSEKGAWVDMDPGAHGAMHTRQVERILGSEMEAAPESAGNTEYAITLQLQVTVVARPGSPRGRIAHQTRVMDVVWGAGAEPSNILGRPVSSSELEAAPLEDKPAILGLLPEPIQTSDKSLPTTS